MLGRLWPRFALEACFLIGVALVVSPTHALDQLSRRQGVTLRRITAARQQLAQDRLEGMTDDELLACGAHHEEVDVQTQERRQEALGLETCLWSV